MPRWLRAETVSFNSLKPPENGKQHQQSNDEKYYAALMMQTPVQETRVDVNGEQSERGNSNSVL
jgi:hypothetical protein